jgi:hypothetical protein
MKFVKYTPWLVPLVLFGAVMSVPLVHKPAQVQMNTNNEHPTTNGGERQSKIKAPARTALDRKNDQPADTKGGEQTPKAAQNEDDSSIKWTDVWIVRLTAVLAALAAAQFTAAWLQARWTRKAVEVAKEAADAARGSADVAKRTADIMEQNAERDLRAYVSLGGPKLADVAAGKQPAAIFNVINSGRTPAQNVQIAIACYASETFDAAKALPPAVPPGASNAFIGIGQRMPSRIVLSKSPISVDLFNAVKDGRYEIFVYGTITYDDSFRTGRTTDFRLSFNAKNIAEKTDGLHNCDEGNRAN